MNRNQIKSIGVKFNELLKSCEPFVSQKDNDDIDRAFRMAVEIYQDKIADTGIPLLEHSLGVARVATDDLSLGAKSIIAALLHNVFLVSGISQKELKNNFDDTVLTLIEGYTRISALPTDKISLQSEKFHQLFLSVAGDIRIILLKIAHRLCDMRNFASLPEEKKRRFANEVEYLYIPISHRLGLYRVKTELEDLLMRFRFPEEYLSIQEQLAATQSKREVFIRDFATPIEKELFKSEITFDIKGRPKSIPSIREKMIKQNVELEEVYDLFAIRIIIDSLPDNEKSDCWKVYSLVTNIYPPNPKRLRDWITTPKASGYESLHTTVRAQNDKWVEVQIRTRRMDEIAEKGQAAHWRYKGFEEKERMEEWLNQIRDILGNPEQIKFDDSPKRSARLGRIYVYTPTGDLVDLPEGATILDFAYSIHSRIGDSCSGARVNNANVPIRHILKNGDRVEIITSKNQKPKQDWLQFVKTSKATAKIKRSLKEQKYQLAEIGLEILKRKLRNWKISYKDEIINGLVKHYKLASSIDLYDLIAEEKLDYNELRVLIREKLEDTSKSSAPRTDSPATFTRTSESDEPEDVLIIDNLLDNVNYRLAKCCNPAPGDKVFGFVTIGKGISIHQVNCPNAKRLLENYGYRKIPVSWKDKEIKNKYIKVVGNDRVGILDEITAVISRDFKVNMTSLKVEKKGGQFFGEIRISVKDMEYLRELLHKIAKVKGVTKAILTKPNA
ncbi:MAG: RelA/SpoT family protein [Bacteroidetes bacterium]|nr:RelA/SpoT family protein [Bacteroidota bacterium]